jgi:hypothetical protein
MPVSSFVEPRRIRIVAEGEYSFEEVVCAFETAIAAAPRRLPVLVDARESRANPPYEELRSTALFAERIADRIGPKIAIVVEGALRYGLARMLSMLGSVDGPLEYGTFRDMERAEAWLSS